MSRFWFQKQTANGDITVSYGYDYALGYFYQEVSADGVLFMDLDSLFGGLTGVQLAERLCGGEDALITCMAVTRYPTGVNPQHVNAMMLDLPF